MKWGETLEVGSLEGSRSLVRRLLPCSEGSRFDDERDLMSSAKQRKHARLTMTPPLAGLDFRNRSRLPMLRAP